MKKALLIFISVITFSVTYGQCNVTLQSGTSNICAGSSVTLGVSHNFTSPVTYNWSNNAILPEITVTPLSSQSFSCIISDGLTTCTTSEFPIIVTAIPVIQSTTPGARCDAGIVNLSTTASAGDINWYTSPTGGTSLITSNTYAPNISATTTYYVDATNNGCTSLRTAVTATINQTPTLSTVNNQSLCAGDFTAAVVFSSTVTGALISWSNNNASIGLLASGNGTISAFNTTNSSNTNTTATITATATANGCTSFTRSFDIVVKPKPVLTIVPNQVYCATDLTSTISFVSNVSGTTIAWSNNNSNIGIPSSGTGNISPFTTTNSTNSTISGNISTIGTASGCNSIPMDFNINVKPKPVVSNVSNQVYCASDLTSIISFTSNVSGTTIAWSNNNSNIGIPSSGTGNISPFTTTNSTNSNISGNISAIGTSNGCSSIPMNFNINVKPKPSIANQNTSICSSVLFSSSWVGIIPTNTNYTWLVTNNTQVVGETNNATAQSFGQTLTNLTLQNQTVVYNVTPVADGCIGNSFTLNLDVKPAPNANSGQDFTKTCLTNTNGNSIGSAPIPGFTYSWSPSSNLSSSTAANPIANPNSTTPYTLTVTDILSGCSASDQVIVSVDNINPVVNAGNDGFISCNQNSYGYTIGITPTANISYSWNPVNGLASSNSSSTVANPNTTTTYTLFAINLSNGCSANDQVVVSVNKSIPSANAGLDITKTCTQNTNGASIGSSSVSGNVYSWSPILGLSSTTIANPTANPTVSTTYTVLVTNSTNGCSNSDQVTVEVNQTPPLAGAGSDFTKTCISNVFGNSIGMSALPNVNYSWSPSTGLTASNIANPIANPTSTTTYELTATSSINGCTATDQLVVSVNQNTPLSNAGSDFTKTCTSNQNGNTIGMNAVAGITYSWLPSTGLTTNNIANPIANPSQTTLYTLTSTDVVNGCTSSDQVHVSVNNSAPTAYAGLDATITCNQNTNGAIIGMPPVSGITYSWTPNNGLTSSNQSEVIANPNGNTTYNLTATNTANGCVSSDAVVVNIDVTPPLVDAGNDQIICQGEQVSLNGTSNGAQVNWTPPFLVQNPNQLSTEGNISGTTTFTLTATGNNGCIAQDYVTAQISIVPSSGLNTSYEICQNETLDLIVNSGVTCSWSGIYTGVGNSVSLGGLESGLLNLNLTNNDGCAASETISVVVNPIPYPIISGAQAVCQNSYWEKYSVPSTSNELAWSVTNGELMSFSNANDAIVHWGIGNSGIINVTETVSQTGCSNNYSYEVLLDNSIALDTAEVLQLSSNVLYTPQDYTFMNWGYQSIQTNIPVSVGVYSQYCNFPNFDPSQNYYWVEIGGGNGCVTKSYFNNPIFTAELEHITSQHINVFPNPTSGFVTIETDFSEFNFEIITMEGQVLKSGKGSYSIDFTDLNYPSGVYYLNIFSNGSLFKHKIIKL